MMMGHSLTQHSAMAEKEGGNKILNPKPLDRKDVT